MTDLPEQQPEAEVDDLEGDLYEAHIHEEGDEGYDENEEWQPEVEEASARSAVTLGPDIHLRRELNQGPTLELKLGEFHGDGSLQTLQKLRHPP